MALSGVNTPLCLQPAPPEGLAYGNWIEAAPPLVQITIISKLDVHTVKDLLIACPLLTARTVLLQITYNNADKPFFFDIPDVHQVQIGYRQRATALLYKCAMVKLVEINSSRWYSTCEGYLNNHLFALDDACCFIAVDKNVKITDTGSKLKEPVFSELRKSKFAFVGSNFTASKGTFTDKPLPRLKESPFFTEVQRILGEIATSDPGLKVKYAIQHFPPPSFGGTLKSLEISGTETVCGLGLPTVVSLTIRFYSPSHSRVSRVDASPTGPPTIKNIIAPVLEYLGVHYSGVMPLIFSNRIGHGQRVLDRGDFEKVGIFELCDTSAYGLRCSARASVSDLTAYTEMDLKFTKFFRYFVVVGAHEFVLRLMDLSEAVELFWMKTVMYKELNGGNGVTNMLGERELIKAPKLEELVIQTNIPGSFLPWFDKLSSLEYLAVFTCAERLELNGVLLKAGDFLERVRIICNLPEEKIGGPGHVTFYKTDVEILFHDKSPRFLKLEGCYFGSDNGILQTKLNFKMSYKTDFRDLSIKFARPKSQIPVGDEDPLKLTLLCDAEVAQFDTLSISQYAVGTRWRSLKLKFPLPDEDKADYFRLVISSEFENVTINNDGKTGTWNKSAVEQKEGRARQWKMNREGDALRLVGLDDRESHVDIC